MLVRDRIVQISKTGRQASSKEVISTREKRNNQLMEDKYFTNF